MMERLEAINILKDFHNNSATFSVRTALEALLPELNESEGENQRIIKAIKYGLDHVFTNNTTVFEVTKEQCLAWLEKQGEHANFRNKIQIGDKVTRNEDGVLVNLSQLNRVATKDDFTTKQERKAEDASCQNIACPTAVDLGLPSGRLWADRNVLAVSPEDAGAYFSWGNVEPHFPSKENAWGTNAFGYQFSREEYVQTVGYKLEDDIPATHDAATVHLGKPWRMPSMGDFEELYEHCDWVRKTINCINGYLFTSKTNGNTLFFPAAGLGYGTSILNAGTSGLYWSRSLYSSAYGCLLSFDSTGVYPAGADNRYRGFSVRAVR